ncbi:twin-arginine translocase subunit TatC [Youngiibacter fragilis]|uniref:Sec-independent protein translocase protein TatC n=1 Tax=Youngiibacter fragilis 232.1 TaxID=994573 RepID=V7I8R4_9CLOT|nr:twin-arginine translocase subunit TatC [Youngiibacter fragilis]ETA81412.1 preprotein translocase subunit TatC [Youngiibacter fragilis 232.1]
MRARIEDLEKDLKKAKKKERKMTLISHLGELRRRLIYSVIFFLGGAGFCYYHVEKLIIDMLDKAPGMEFVAIAPEELLLSQIRIAFLGGVIVASPLIIMQIWLFIKPGLVAREKRYLLLSLFVGAMFFASGLAFAYMVILPMTLKFLAGFEMDRISSLISFSSYLSFATNMLLSFGLVFELPIVMLLLSLFGILKAKTVVKFRKHILIIILTVAAFLTPPDIVSQLLMAVPMLVLFEVGIMFARVAEKSRNRRLSENL